MDTNAKISSAGHRGLVGFAMGTGGSMCAGDTL